MHCKFWGFPYFLLFLLSACEFQFIKIIGAHGKQNPGFIYYYKHHKICYSVEN